MSSVFSGVFARQLVRCAKDMQRGKQSDGLKRLQAEFGKTLQSWLRRRQTTLKALAIDLEMDLSQLSKIRSGRGNLTLRTMYRVMTGLKVQSVTEFYAVKDHAAIEHRFEDEFTAFRQLLLEADEEGLNDLRKALRRIPMEGTRTGKSHQPAASGQIVDLIEWTRNHTKPSRD